MLKIGETWFDIVNLWKEEYVENSAVPIISPGTALEDTLWWDLTINALFYNTKEKTIEDLSGKGIEDI